MKEQSVIHSNLRARKIKTLEMSNVTDQAVNALARIGLVFDYATVNQQLNQLEAAGAFRTGVGMDSAFTAPITTPSIPTPIQFLQNWLPGFVKIMTTARKIDELIGIQTVGSWEDEEIIQGMVEPAGVATEYGDHTNIPLASWNANFERRTIVRAEMGINVGLLEEGRAAKMRLNSAETKRQAAAISLELFRNAVGFFGWRSGGNRTFGFLNDPNLPPMITSSVVGGWGNASTTFQQIIGDVRSWMVALRTQTGDNIDLNQVDVTLALPTRKIDYLTITTDFGVSVRDWLTQTYKGLRIVSAPELQGAGANVGTDDVAYLYLDSIDTSIDGSTDDGDTFGQLVPTKFMTLGTEKRAKSYVEDYSAATAGVLCKRPFAVVRISGI